MSTALSQSTNSNVVMVDWSAWTRRFDYMDVVKELPTVSSYVVEWFTGLRNRGIVKSFDDVTLIGHSLGGQLSGYVGHRLNGTVKRIVGA